MTMVEMKTMVIGMKNTLDKLINTLNTAEGELEDRNYTN